MREIKFRAWDEGCMLGPMGLQLSDSAEWIYNLTNDAILMQYTGMKDRYGVEIYEGDIATFNVSRDMVGDLADPLIGMKGEVMWDSEDAGYFFMCDGSWPHIKTYFATDIEITGNVLEKEPE